MPEPTDPFFILRDCRDLMQRRLSDIARLAGVSSPQLLAAYARQIGEAHDELASSSRADGFGQTAGLTASRISLVGNDDLELEIRIGDIAGRLKDNEQIDHWRVQLRYKTLLNRPRMSLDNNPAGFEPISLGLWTLCKESGNALEQNLALLSRMEDQLQLQLPELYRELNELLERHDVEPAQVELIQRERGPAPRTVEGTSAGPAVQSTAGNNALAGLQLAMQQQAGGDTGLRTSDAPGAQTGNFTLNAATLQMLNQLMERLRVFELQQETGLADFSFDAVGTGTSQAATDGPAPRVLKSKDIDLPLGKPAALALDTLSLIFETLFASPELPTAIKRILGRLQIPLLKVAILDAAFFADPNHPARRLINRMARAAIGLHADADRDHPVCVFLAHLADLIRATLESGDGQIEPHLAELDRFIDARDQTVQASGQAYIALIQRHETQAAARLAAGDWLRKLRVTQSVPALEPFLATLWLPAMRDAWLDGGTGGPRWAEHDATIQNLLWSTRPVGNPEDRKKLLSLIPILLRRINAEFDRMQIASEVRKPFLDTCFELQTTAMRGATSMPGIAQDIEPLIAEALGSDSDAPILEEDGKLVQYLARPEAEQTRLRSSLPPCKPGDWLIFDLPDEAQQCGCCCGVLTPFGTVVLFNPEWAYALALAPALLEQQLRDGRARLLTARALFDEAAQRALAQIAAG